MVANGAGPDGLGRLERVVARDEIRQLVSRYAHAVDIRDIDLLVSLFVPDVRVGNGRSGRAALYAFWEGSLSDIGVSILFVGNHVIDFGDPTHATGVVYCRGQIQDGDRWIEQAIRYLDDYERVGEEWLFVRRRHELWYGVETAEHPLAQEPANWPDHHTGLGTVPYHEETWQRFWGGTD